MIKLPGIKRILKPFYLTLAGGISRLHLFFCRLAAKRRWPKLAALLLLLSIKELKETEFKLSRPPADRSAGPAKPRPILVLSRSIFNEDVLVSLQDPSHQPEKHSGQQVELFHLYTLPRKVVKALASGFLPPYINDGNYVSSDPTVERGKADYRRFLISLWEAVQEKIAFQAILTGNFGYHAEKELAAAAESLGIPFIALHKENLKSPGLIRHWEKIYRERRGPFLGRKIFVYNQVEKEIQVASGMFPAEKIIITGMPRLDRVHSWRIKSAAGPAAPKNEPQILFFSFSPEIGLPAAIKIAGYQNDEASKQWLNLSRQTFTTLVEVAKENPGIRVVIKMKKKASTGLEEKLLKELLGSRKLPNLELAYGGDPFSLITRSNVICGFNSTALLEAIAADKRVVVPHFEEALNEDMVPYIVDLEDAVDYSSSPKDLKESLIRYADETRPPRADLSPSRKRVLEQWMGNSDGQSAKRVREALVAELARNS